MQIICAKDHVRCLDSRGSKGALKSGQVYEVLWARRFPDSVILKDVEGDWLQSRFELVSYTKAAADHALRMDQMDRARRRLVGPDKCENGKTAIADCNEHYCKTSGRCSLAMQDYSDRKEGRL